MTDHTPYSSTEPVVSQLINNSFPHQTILTTFATSKQSHMKMLKVRPQ